MRKESKLCKTCNTEKPRSAFYQNADGYLSWQCKDCQKAYQLAKTRAKRKARKVAEEEARRSVGFDQAAFEKQERRRKPAAKDADEEFN